MMRMKKQTTWMMAQEIRAMISGLPIFVTIGSRDYQSQDRSRLKELVDGLELLAKYAHGRRQILRMHAFAAEAKKEGRVRVSTDFFPEQLRALAAQKDTLLKSRPDLAGGDDVPGATQAALIGARATAIDRQARPMAFIAAVVAWHFKVPIEALYLKSKAPGAREQPAARVRQGCYALIKDTLPHKTICEIGRHFGRDHTTVLHGVQACTKVPEFARELDAVRAKLSAYF